MTKASKRSRYSEYNNYKLDRCSHNNKLDIVQLDDPSVTKEWFFNNYILPRKPALIKCIDSSKVGLDVNNFKPENILNTLHDQNGDDSDYLQVEEIKEGGFGSGQKRIKLKLEEFIKRIKAGETLYMTTQYAENNPDALFDDTNDIDEKNVNVDDEGEEEEEEEEDNDTGFKFPSDAEFSDTDDFNDQDLHDDFEEEFPEEEIVAAEDIDPIYQPPLSNLLSNGHLENLPPYPIDVVKSLIPQQINMWFGRTPSDTTELKVEKSGEEITSINKGLPSKNSTSTGLHHDHADNIYVLIQGKKRFTLFSPDFAPDLYTTGDIRCIYDTGVIDYIRNEKAPFWNSIRGDGGCIATNDEETSSIDTEEQSDEKRDPPSFCKIPPALLHLDKVDPSNRTQLEKYIKDKYPTFYPIKDSSIQVTLEDGDLLYLPAGWFHEVTSYGDEKKDNVHVAINYWFVPPDGHSVTTPYTDLNWKNDFKIWKEKYL